MLKSIFLTAVAAATLSTAAIAAPAQTRSFVHDGNTYVYSIKQKANTRILRGKVENTGKPFVLYVSNTKVTGTVDGGYVSFLRSDVKSIANDVTVASR